MRLRDAIASLQLDRKKDVRVHRLSTVWSEQADDSQDAIPLPEYPRPQFRRSEWKCLNGWWDYSIRCSDGPMEKSMGEADGRILVPFSPETERSGVGRVLLPGETLWYRKIIENLCVPEGKRLILHFGAVDERCIVWWNGSKAGVHRNGYLSFSFDVTDAARPGTNILEVCVRDDTDQGTACRGKQTLNPGGMYYHAQSGIWQTVWLETVPENYLRNLRITPFPKKAEVELKMRFAGGEDKEKKDNPRIRITVFPPVIVKDDTDSLISAKGAALSKPEDEREGAGKGNPGQCSEKETGRREGAGKTYIFQKKREMKVRIPVPDPQLWCPESPFLYPVLIEAGEDVVESYFAMRSFGTGTDVAGRQRLLMNGTSYFFNGVLDQGYWPESLMTPPADEALVYDIRQMKELGFNMLRKHVKIEPARWYWHCDRIGMVVWQDMVNGGGPVRKLLETYLPTIFPPIGTHLPDCLYILFSRQDAGARRRFEADMRRMIRQLYNCPCIGMWVPFNEGWGQFDALRIADEVKKEDPTRPVDHASGWFDQGGGDVRSVHNYFRPLTVEPGRRAFVLSEYGGADCSIAGHSMSEEEYGYRKLEKDDFPQSFRELMEQISTLSEEGLSGAVYTQISDIEEETNGLLTYDRKVRKA